MSVCGKLKEAAVWGVVAVGSAVGSTYVQDDSKTQKGLQVTAVGAGTLALKSLGSAVSSACSSKEPAEEEEATTEVPSKPTLSCGTRVWNFLTRSADSSVGGLVLSGVAGATAAATLPLGLTATAGALTAVGVHQVVSSFLRGDPEKEQKLQIKRDLKEARERAAAAKKDLDQLDDVYRQLTTAEPGSEEKDLTDSSSDSDGLAEYSTSEVLKHKHTRERHGASSARHVRSSARDVHFGSARRRRAAGTEPGPERMRANIAINPGLKTEGTDAQIKDFRWYKGDGSDRKATYKSTGALWEAMQSHYRRQGTGTKADWNLLLQNVEVIPPSASDV